MFDSFRAPPTEADVRRIVNEELDRREHHCSKPLLPLATRSPLLS